MSCQNKCANCGKLFEEHWAPYGFCSLTLDGNDPLYGKQFELEEVEDG